MSFTQYKNHKNIQISQNIFIKTLVDKLRNVEASSEDFFEVSEIITQYLCLEALENLKTKKDIVKGVLNPEIKVITPDEKISLIPILRAGMIMLSSAKKLLGNYADVSFIDYARDEKTLEPKENYKKLSGEIPNNTALIIDPMLATGGTLSACITQLKKVGCKKIISLSIISAPEGIEKVISEHPDIIIYTAQLDEKLNDKGFILPGLGDYGDRSFGGFGG
jgi:uracil phosphoribosyltransferase